MFGTLMHVPERIGETKAAEKIELMSERNWDVIIVGAGVVGLAHAWSAAKAGKRVLVFERNHRAQGASVRNFGMVWPIGRASRLEYDTAIRSRAAWLELAREAGLWSQQCGSIHLTYRDDETSVAQEFVATEQGREARAEWLDCDEVLRRSPAAKREGLQGGLWSPMEVRVNPRQAIAAIPIWLDREFNVEFRFGHDVGQVTSNQVVTSAGEQFESEKIIVCGGHETRVIFPKLYDSLGLSQCKLQMMSTRPQPNRWDLGPHIASGLTFQHYSSFDGCPSLSSLRDRIESETPELNRYGIHVLASQNELGQVIHGDSHEHGPQVSPLDKSEIETLILRELRRIIDLPDWSIESRWHGVYAMHDSGTVIEETPCADVHICIIAGGAGMTLAMGSAEAFWNPAEGKRA